MSASAGAREYALGRVLQGAVIAAVGAAAVNLALYFAARAAGVTFSGRFEPTAPETVVLPGPVTGASMMWVIPASIAVLVLNRFMKKPSKVFVPGAALLGLLSIAGPLTFPQASLGTKLALSMMHVVVTVAIVGAIGLRGKSAA